MKAVFMFPFLFFFFAETSGFSSMLLQDGANELSPEKTKKKIFKDSLDGKLDMSRFLIDLNGFIPIPQIVTEPALGHIGLMLTPVFITPNKVQEKGKYTPPDITAAFVGYTANNTWGFGGFRAATLPKHHLKYRVGAAYGNVNMDFYRTLPIVGERKFGFNFKSTGVYGSLLRGIGDSDVYIGLEYLYLCNKTTPEFEHIDLPDFVTEEDIKHNLSSVGINLEVDKRDNVFTPDNGWYLRADFRINASWTGSDYDYQNLNVALFKFFQTTEKLVSGFRLESKFQFGDAPFYSKPAISLRGVPMARYQGDQTYVLETEQRYDVITRWSILGFGGLAKAPTQETSFSDSKLVYNYGTGFRYLIARKFQLRMGVDVAWSNDDFGWYIVFGSAWNNRN